MKNLRIFLSSTVCLFTLLQAPIVHADKKDAGAILGVILGGVVGNKLGHGDVGATIVGAVVGGVVFGAIGRELDENDRQEAMRARGDCLERNERSEWRGNGGYGSIVVLQEGYHNNSPSMVCRSYESTIFVNGRRETTRGYACRDNYGNWNEVHQTEMTYGQHPGQLVNQYPRPIQNGPDYGNNAGYNDQRHSGGHGNNELQCVQGYGRSALLIDRRSNMQIAQYSIYQNCQLALDNSRGPLICVEAPRYNSYAMDIRTRQSVGYLYLDIRECVSNLR